MYEVPDYGAGWNPDQDASGLAMLRTSSTTPQPGLFGPPPPKVRPSLFKPTGDLAELRRQQAEFARVRGGIADRYSWMAVPALAPLGVLAALEAPGVLAARGLGSVGKTALEFGEREPWQVKGARPARQRRPGLDKYQKDVLRDEARKVFEQANAKSGSEMEAEVHHSSPLEFAHVFPKAHPNRLANLWGLGEDAHDLATGAWRTFSNSLKGRVPKQAEIMAEKLRIDRMVEPYLRRAGATRPPAPPKPGPPK